MSWTFFLVFLSIVACCLGQEVVETHTSNWAVLVCASRYWFNYRHIANTLSLYHTIKAQGIPDSQIILMLADDMPCNARNKFPAQVFNDRRHSINLYDEDIEVDYRGEEANVENVLRVLTGRHESHTPASKRLDTDEHSNILIYLTGHGGEEFLKFHDKEEIQSQDLADAFEQMHHQRRYNSILFMIDTCQATTLFRRFYSPNLISVGSSKLAENSLSYEHDGQLGVSVIDRFTYYTLDFFERLRRSGKDMSRSSVGELFRSYDPRLLRSHAEWSTTSGVRSLKKTPLLDYFGATTSVRLTYSSYHFRPRPRPLQSASQHHSQSSHTYSPFSSLRPPALHPPTHAFHENHHFLRSVGACVALLCVLISVHVFRSH